MQRAHRSVHSKFWIVLAVALPIGAVLAYVLSGGPPADPSIEAVRAAAAGE